MLGNVWRILALAGTLALTTAASEPSPRGDVRLEIERLLLEADRSIADKPVAR